MSTTSVSLDDNKLREFYGRFQEQRRLLPEIYPLARYDDSIGSGKYDGSALAVVTLAPEHVAAAVNRINRFCYELYSLNAWNKVFDTLTEDDRYASLYEFVFPLVSSALTQPYSIKQMLIRSTCEISHQTNLLTKEGWREELLREKPNFPDAEKQAMHFASWPSMYTAFSRLDTNDFRDASDHYRDRFNHGFPRRIEFGHMWTMTRQVVAGRMTYTLGEAPPLKMADIMPLLEEQYVAASNCLNTYVELIKEQAGLWPKAG